MKKVIAAVIALCVTACLLASCQIIRTPIKNVFIVDNAKTYTLVEDVPQSGRESSRSVLRETKKRVVSSFCVLTKTSAAFPSRFRI